MKTNFTHYLISLALIGLLAGCMPPPPPTIFGVPQDQWRSLSPEQQNEVIRGYNQRKQQAEENAPLIAAVGAVNNFANLNMQERNNRQHREDMKKQGFPEWMG